MQIVIVPFGQLPPDDHDADVLTVPEDDNCHLRLVDMARKHLKAQGRYVSGIWDRRRVDGRFWVSAGTSPGSSTKSRGRCR